MSSDRDLGYLRFTDSDNDTIIYFILLASAWIHGRSWLLNAKEDYEQNIKKIINSS